MGAEKRQATGALLLALLLCGQLAAAAGQGARVRPAAMTGTGLSSSQYVTSKSAANRSLLELHISLLKKLQALTAQRAAKASPGGKGPRASQALPTLPGTLASSLEQWRNSFDWSGPPTGDGWQGIASAPQAASLAAEARSLARYYTQPETVALLKANPSQVPTQLRGPAGMTRQQACEGFNKFELPDQIKRQICDPTYPWISAESAAGLDLEGFLEPQAGIIAGQLSNWDKQVANGWGSQSRGRAPHYNISTPKLPRRSLQGSCSGIDSFYNFLLGDGRDYLCLGIDCEMQIPGVPLYFYIGMQGCFGIFKIVNDILQLCGQTGCHVVDVRDTAFVKVLMTHGLTETKVDVHAGVCLGVEGLTKVLKKLGLSACIGPTLTVYPLTYQMVGTFGFTLIIAGLEFGSTLQIGSSSNNPFCNKIASHNPDAWNKFAKCQSYCDWKAGRGTTGITAWLNLLIYRKSWYYTLLADPVTPCDP